MINKSKTFTGQEKTPEIDIYKQLARSNAITWGFVVLSTVSILATVISYNNFKSELALATVDKVLKLKLNGEVVSGELVDRSETLEIELKDHLNIWVARWLNFDYNNVRTSPKRAQWLMSAPDFAVQVSKEENWHKEVEAKKLTQKTELIYDSVKVSTEKEPFTFSAPAIVSLTNGFATNKYKIIMTGEIKGSTADFPKNPHGFTIYNYQKRVVKLD